MFCRIIFLFHKNGQLSSKAKVKPPRLDGQRVGVYSTRSPHRPNALGLTLAKLDKIEGGNVEEDVSIMPPQSKPQSCWPLFAIACSKMFHHFLFKPVFLLLYPLGDTVYLSDIDMIAGTPVLDIKPYIPEYDSPITRKGIELCNSNAEEEYDNSASLDEKIDVSDHRKDSETVASDTINHKPRVVSMEDDCPRGKSETEVLVTQSSHPLTHLHSLLKDVKAYVAQHDFQVEEKVSASPGSKAVELGLASPHYGEETFSTIASWIREPPISSLEVRFTPHAERELAQFLPTDPSSETFPPFHKKVQLYIYKKEKI